MVKSVSDVIVALNNEERLLARLINEAECRIERFMKKALLPKQSFQQLRIRIQHEEAIIEKERQKLNYLHDLMANVLFSDEEKEEVFGEETRDSLWKALTTP